MNTKVAIIGYGWVGKAMHELFPGAFVYDPQYIHHEGKLIKTTRPWSAEQKEMYQRYVNECDVAFVCVPTPNKKDGSLDTEIVEYSVNWCESDLIVIRSTVNPGTADDLMDRTGKRIVVQPEYLGETPAHPLLDPTKRSFLVIGGDPVDRRKLIELYTTVYNANVSIRQVSAKEAEVIKLSENRAIAWKVAQCQELYDVCELAGVDYYMVRDTVYGDDPRFNLWFSFIFPDNRGMNSKCIPKDVYAWRAWAESCGYEPKITSKLLEKNLEWVGE